MQRSVAASLRRELDRQESGEALLVFMTITSPEVPDVIRVVSDGKDYVWKGNTFTGFWFDITLLTDTEGPPEARLTVQNVDQKIGEAMRKLTRPPRMRLDVLPVSEFDTSVSPRTDRNQADSPASNAVPAYSADHLYLTDVSVNVMDVTASIRSWNYSQRAWPGRLAGKPRCPALFA